jgi:hypothetical protein
MTIIETKVADKRVGRLCIMMEDGGDQTLRLRRGPSIAPAPPTLGVSEILNSDETEITADNPNDSGRARLRTAPSTAPSMSNYKLKRGMEVVILPQLRVPSGVPLDNIEYPLVLLVGVINSKNNLSLNPKSIGETLSVSIKYKFLNPKS